MSSIQTQFMNFKTHHTPYTAIDPSTTLKGSANGKIVFISGASQGIGEATAIAFAQAGAKAIFITSRTEEGLKKVKAKITDISPETLCAYQVCDVTKANEVENAIETCVSLFGGIDILDANAGYLGKWDKIGESDIHSWWRSFEVNIQGVYHAVRYAIPHLRESVKRYANAGKSQTGYIILISSVGAQLLTPGASDYQVSKHAINRLCEFVDVDHERDGIKCFAVHPGGVATTLAKNMPEAMHQYLDDSPALAGSFIVWLTSGQADWAKGRYLSCNWDVEELLACKEEIVKKDLLVNRLRTSG